MTEDFVDQWRIVNRGNDLQSAAAVGAVFDVDIKDSLSSRTQLMRGDALCA